MRTLCLVALAALMAMALAGAPSAIAEETALCPSEEEKCQVISHVHETSVGQAALLTSLLTVECDVLFLGDSAEPGSPLVFEGTFVYTNCGSCTVEEVSAHSTIKALKTGHETSSITGEGEVHVNCSGFNCYYSSKGLEGTGTGPLLSSQKNGEVLIAEQEVNKTKGLFCPKSGFLDLTTTPLVASYIVEPNKVHALACIKRALGRYDTYKCDSENLDLLKYELFAY